MRRRRLLLATAALSTATWLPACGKDKGPPANPKGSVYDAGDPIPLPANPKGSFYDAGAAAPVREREDAGAPTSDAGKPTTTSATSATKPTPQPKPTPTLKPLPLPANPKGSHYDKKP